MNNNTLKATNLKIVMKISELLTRIEKEDFYKKFKSENQDSYVCAMLCILSKNEREGDKIQLDFYMPSKKKLAFTEYPFNQMQFPKETVEKMTKLKNDEMAFEVNELWEIIENAKKQKDTFHNTRKIIGILKDDRWILTCLDDMMGIIKLNINSLTGKIEKFEKGNLTDFMGFKKTK